MVELLLDSGASVDKPNAVNIQASLYPNPQRKSVFYTAYPCVTVGPHRTTLDIIL